MSESLVQRLGALTVPRYTSYPTAADFSAEIGPTEAARWLADADAAEPVSIYLHVPYCRELCHYCGCHAKAARRADVVQRYRETLEAEIALVASRLPGRLPVSRISWGGGTPSILGLSGLGSVLHVLSRHFDLRPGHEHAMELDPRRIDQGFADGLAALGLNRASLGVQDLDRQVQQAIGRVQPAETVRGAVAILRRAGIARLNFDLVYGLPRQSVESLRRTCHEVIGLAPDRIACYGYAHLPTRRANQRLIDETLLPGADERLRQQDAVAAAFTEVGYQSIGIDHFALFCDPLAVAARSRRLHRNFQGYTDDGSQTLIGFGASSISRLSGGFAQNESAIEAWRARIEAGKLATRRGHAFRQDDRERAAIIERLMCDFRVDLGRQARLYADELALLRPLVGQGLVEMRHDTVTLTPKGRPFVRLVSAVFDRFRTEGERGFSSAV